MVSPGDFIPLFERNGFIVDLDAFVFEEACAYLASRGSRGLPPLRLSVNVSRLSIAQGDFLDRYSAIRDKYGIDSGMLELECTETMVIRNFALFRELMAALPSRGFRSAMDDFGTGYRRSTCSEIARRAQAGHRLFPRHRHAPRARRG
ncbi:MAG: EAL domain-containing protein [Bilophila wadsworthia]